MLAKSVSKWQRLVKKMTRGLSISVIKVLQCVPARIPKPPGRGASAPLGAWVLHTWVISLSPSARDTLRRPDGVLRGEQKCTP